MRRGIEYVEVGVSDLERSERWYEQTLGLPSLPAAVRLVPAGDGANGWLDDNRQRGIRHVGFKVADVDAHADRLRTAGVEFAIALRLEVVGQLFFGDEQGFVITYLRAGEHVLELFSYDAATTERPPGTGLGFRALGIAGERLPAHVG